MTAPPKENEGSFDGLVGQALGAEGIDEFLALVPDLAQDVRDIEEHVAEVLPASYPFLAEAAAYATASGGKRVRPLLMVVAHRALGNRDTRAIQPLAAAFQLIHTATLVHDDVIDHASLRRGKPSVFKAFGMPAAIVAGDYLFVRAFQLASRYSQEVILRCGEACADLAQGEVMQENSRWDLTTGRERYLRIMVFKTASIVAAGLASVGMVAGGSRELVEGLTEYGRALGVAFQIQDDILDVYGDPDVTGKPLFSDFREGLPTLLTTETHLALSGRDKAEFERLFTIRRKRPTDLLRLKELTDATDARRLVIEEAERWAHRGASALTVLPDGPYRHFLERLAKGAVARRF